MVLPLAEKILAFVGASFLSWLLGSLVEELSIHLEDRSQTLIGILEHISELFYFLGLCVTIPVSLWLLPRIRSRVRCECENSSREVLKSAEHDYMARQEKAIAAAEAKSYSDGHAQGEKDASEKERRVCFDLYMRNMHALRDRALAFMEPYHSTPAFLAAKDYSFIEDPRLYSALNEPISYDSPVEISANISGLHGIYHTTLYDCTCPDFQFRRQPCKHMYYLAVDLGLLSTLDTQAVESSLSELNARLESVEKEKRRAEKVLSALEQFKTSLAVSVSEPPEKLVPPKNMWLPLISSAEDRKKCMSLLSLYEWNSKDRYQIALNAWNAKKKNRPQLGLEFERYVGSQYERAGNFVQYNGAECGKGDLGCDLLVFKRDLSKLCVVQCKYWASEKELHTNVVTQLFGTVSLFQAKHPDIRVDGHLVCSCSISAEAKAAFAHFPNLHYYENYSVDLRNYPAVKCAMGAGGEMYFYLPFDKCYDSVVADRYVSTVTEAKAAGYTRPIG